MDNSLHDIYRLDKNDEKELWNNCVFMLDASALLNLHKLDETRFDTVNMIFKSIRSRLVLPNHVIYEYSKNRDRVIREQNSCCLVLNDKFIKNNSSKYSILLDEVEKIEEISNKNHNYYQMNVGLIDELKEQATVLKENLESFNQECEKLISENEKMIIKIIAQDPVYKLIDKYFKIDSAHGYKDLVQLIKEAKLRFEFKIPPGFGDLKNKTGIQVFGDLILWKQIVEFAAKKKVGIVFITDDVSKGDWYKKNSRGKIKYPHNDLIREINIASGKRFWMYTLEQFLFLSKQYLTIDITEDKIENAREMLKEKTDVQIITSHCNSCAHINQHVVKTSDIEYELLDTQVIEDAAWRFYMADMTLYCNNCGIPIKFHSGVCVDAVGCITHRDAQLEGAVMKKVKFTQIDS